jgi:hypothetical protein
MKVTVEASLRTFGQIQRKLTQLNGNYVRFERLSSLVSSAAEAEREVWLLFSSVSVYSQLIKSFCQLNSPVWRYGC